jgi:hypothetical protein
MTGHTPQQEKITLASPDQQTQEGTKKGSKSIEGKN